jgi:hypothetical protein
VNSADATVSLDALSVLEEVMAHFYFKAKTLKGAVNCCGPGRDNWHHQSYCADRSHENSDSCFSSH